MKRTLLPALLILLSVGLVAAQTSVTVADDKQTSSTQQAAYVRPDKKNRIKHYAKSMFGPEALIKAVANAGISTAKNSPREWGPHWEGFGRRFSSNLGKGIINSTVSYGLDEAFKLDSRFYRSQKRNVKARVANALISPFTARNESGKRVFGFPKIAGAYTSNVIAAETWYPARYNYKDGLKSGTISLGMSVVFNLVREFWKK